MPAEGLAHGVGSRSREHRDGQQARADDTKCKDHEGRSPGDRLQRLGGLGGGLDVGGPMGV